MKSKELFDVFNNFALKAEDLKVSFTPTIESSYKKETEKVISELDIDKLKRELKTIFEPAVYVKARDDSINKNRSHMEVFIKERDVLIAKINDLEKETKIIQTQISILPIRASELFDRYNFIVDFIKMDSEFYTKIRELETIAMSRSEKMLHNKVWKKAMFIIELLSIVLIKMLSSLDAALTSNTVSDLKLNVDNFDAATSQMIDYIRININSSIDSSVINESEVSSNYDVIDEYIHNINLHVKDIIGYNITIEKYIKRLVQISQERKRIDLVTETLNKKIDPLKEYIDNNQGYLDALWNVIIVNFNDFPMKVKAIFKVSNFQSWDDSRNKLSIISKMSLISNNIKEFFGSMIKLFEESEEIYKRTMRKYYRYKDSDSKTVLDLCTMRDTEPSEIAKIFQSTFNILYDHMQEKSRSYNEYPSKFYEDNTEIINQLYIMMPVGLKEWSQAFSGMFPK